MDLSSFSKKDLNNLQKNITLEKRRRDLDVYVSNITKNIISRLYGGYLKFEFELYDFNKSQIEKVLNELEIKMNEHFSNIENIETFNKSNFDFKLLNPIGDYVRILCFGGEWNSDITMSWVKKIYKDIPIENVFKNGLDKDVSKNVINSYNDIFNKKSYLKDDFNTFTKKIKSFNKIIEIEILNKKLNTTEKIIFDMNKF